MINKQEFRIGNYVSDKLTGEWMIVDEIGENVGATIVNRDKFPLPDGWEMQPILLSPTILTKAGFDNGILRLTDTFRLIYWYGEGILELINKHNNYDLRMDHIVHLHQLQNFYYAISGTELKIEL